MLITPPLRNAVSNIESACRTLRADALPCISEGTVCPEIKSAIRIYTNDKRAGKQNSISLSGNSFFPGRLCPCVRGLAFLKKGYRCFVCIDWQMHSFGEDSQKSLKRPP